MSSRKCIACDNKATKRLSPDLDIVGIHVCDDHVDEVREDLLIGILIGDLESFEAKYYDGDKTVDEQD